MRATVQDLALFLAGNGALVRVGAVVVGVIRSVARRREFTTVRFGLVEAVAWLEPPALGVTAYLLLTGRENEGDPSWFALGAAVAGAMLVILGLALMAWSLWSWRQLFVGHAVLEEHELVTRGAYGLVRHPVYVAADLVWAGLALSFLDPVAAALTVLYVIPVYYLYARSEERMMLQSFGDAYRRYSSSVPAFAPRIRRA
jgi:protein-S-isoprenylcysteine O-methyltransferase Ste14